MASYLATVAIGEFEITDRVNDAGIRVIDAVDPDVPEEQRAVLDLTDDQLVALRDHIEGNYEIEGDLRRTVAADIRRKVEIGNYQGRRHRQGLPVRGQRTRTNARTRKGPRRAAQALKK